MQRFFHLPTLFAVVCREKSVRRNFWQEIDSGVCHGHAASVYHKLLFEEIEIQPGRSREVQEYGLSVMVRLIVKYFNILLTC